MEKNVLEKLSRYVEMDKNLSKAKERLKTATTDYELSKKAAEKKEEKGGGFESHQEEVDSSLLKLENNKVGEFRNPLRHRTTQSRRSTLWLRKSRKSHWSSPPMSRR